MIQRILSGLLFVFMIHSLTGQPSQFIHVDQFGYHISADKVAVLSDPQTGYNAALSYSPSATVELRNAATHSVVYSAAISQWNSGNTHSHSGDRGWWFDFSTVTTPGSYYVHDATNNESSAVFAISDYPYGNVLKAAGRAFYYNRCNFPKLEEHAGAIWSDATNFLNPLQDANCRYVHDKNNAALEKDLSGGWFDAGDYNKYVTFTYSTLHDLLYAFEESRTVFGDDWNIPESGNGIPDLIDEIKWELDWMIKMTNPDGSVHIKMGSQNYSENTGAPPSVNTHQRFYGPTCTSASATVASVFAHASIVFGQFPEYFAYAATLLAIAQSAFDFAMPHYTNNTFETNCDNGEIVSGDADKSVQEQKDMMISAAVYLFEKTGSSAYNSFVISNYTQAKPMVDNFWGPYTIPVQDALLRYTSLPGANASASASVINAITTHANNNWNGFYGWSDNDLYRAFMPEWSYHWGSNQTKASYGNLNNRLADMGIGNQASFYKKAHELVHYYHGVNPQGMVYLSNMYSFGAERSANEIYHTWFNDGTHWDNALTSLYGPAPGFLSGGPNKDFTVASIIPPSSQPPQKSYKDWNTGWPQNSWEITEPSIYNQAAYIRLLARSMHLMRQMSWSGAESTDWSTDENWSQGFVPTENFDLTILPSANDPILDQDRTLGNLGISSGATITIPAGTALTVSGKLENQNGAAGIFILSNSSAAGSLIHQSPNVEATVERYIGGYSEFPSEQQAFHGWHFLSAPAANKEISPQFIDITVFPISNLMDFYKWSEPLGSWINIKANDGSYNQGNNLSNWSPEANPKFETGRGYLIAYHTTATKQFTGVLNVDDVEVAGLTNTIGNVANGWHLLGNPFSSAISFNSGSWNKTNVAATVQVWNQSTASYEVLTGSQIIPAHNGFMIYTTGNGALTIPADARQHSTYNFYKNIIRDENMLVLTAFDQDGGTAQQTIVQFHHDATEEFDQQFDSYFLAGYAPRFYSKSQNRNYALNGLPVNDEFEIALGFEKNKNTNFVIELTQNSTFRDLYLQDNKTGLMHKISESSYHFHATEGDHPDRFLLLSSPTNLPEILTHSTLQVFSHGNTIYIKNAATELLQLALYDLRGRLILLKETSSPSETLTITSCSGAYILQVSSNNTIENFKVLLK